MFDKNKRRLALWIMAALLLGGCTSKTVTVVDEGSFCAMGQRIKPVLQSHGILDDNGSYMTSLVSSNEAPADAGKRLYERLCPAFRFPDVDPNSLPATFAASKAQGDALEVRPAGFMLSQGSRMISVNLLGLADWDGDGRKDWFVQCDIRSLQSKDQRIYYLVVEDPDAEVMRPRLMGIYDCRGGRCETITGVALRQNQGFTPESTVVDLMPGQQSVTAPPAGPIADSPRVTAPRLSGRKR